MLRRLRNKIAEDSQRRIRLHNWRAEAIELPEASVDTVVATLVLCSVADLAASLQELYRLLRPGGQLLFLEHVRAVQPRTRLWQRRLEPYWSCCAGGCLLTRQTDHAIRAAGFAIEDLIDEPICGAPAFVSRSLRGRAVKPSQPETDRLLILEKGEM